MTLALAEDEAGLVDPSAVEQVLGFDADVIAAGPGLGRRPASVRSSARSCEQCPAPLVLDADAIVAFCRGAGSPAGAAKASSSF